MAFRLPYSRRSGAAGIGKALVHPGPESTVGGSVRLGARYYAPEDFPPDRPHRR